jgi:CBS domain-containing protein
MKVLDRVSMVLREKGNAVYSLPPDATVYSAIELMADKGVGALLVIDGDRLVGIISERDYARKIILEGKSSSDTFIHQIMTPSPVTIRCEDTVDEAMRRMTENRIRHLPVVDSEGHVAGMLSIGDLVKWIVTSQDETIAHLEHYIAGGGYH